MKTQEELRKELNKAFCAANEQAHVTSWTEFAKFVDIPYPTIYRYVNSKANMTESMLTRINRELATKGVTIESSTITIASNTAQNVNAPVTQTTTDERWFDLVQRKDDQIAEKDAQINRLLSIIEKMQG